MTLLLINLISTVFTSETSFRIPTSLWFQWIEISFSSRLSLVLGAHWLWFFSFFFLVLVLRALLKRACPDAVKQMCSEGKIKKAVTQLQRHLYVFASKWNVYESFFVGSSSVKAFLVFQGRTNSTTVFVPVALVVYLCLIWEFAWSPEQALNILAEYYLLKGLPAEKARRCGPCSFVNTITSSEDCSQQGRPKQGNLAI